MVDAAQFQAHEHASENVGAPLPATSATPIDAAMRVLFPWSNSVHAPRPNYPGLRAGIRQLVGSRAALHTVRDYCRGRRQAPRWLIKLLDDELAKKEQAIQEARKGLAAYQHRPKPEAPLIRYWQKKKAAAIERPSE